MKPALLDTDILLDIMHGSSIIVQQNANRYLTAYGRYTISAVTVAEFVRGVCRYEGAQSLMDALLAGVEVVPLEASSARLAGQIYAELESLGQTIGLADSLIAGIALQSGRVLVSANTRHFGRIVELGYPLEVINWRESD